MSSRAPERWFTDIIRKVNRFIICSLLAGSCLLTGCDRAQHAPRSETSSDSPLAPALHDPLEELWNDLLTRLKAANPEFHDAGADSVAYRGDQGQLTMIELRHPGIHDLTPLQGLPLTFLALTGCPVRDLSPLRGMPLEELALEQTEVSDLSPLTGMALHTLWLNRSPVSDLGPLRGMPLGSLNLLGTRVTDLSPLQGMPLESLWLNETEVEDLSPLRDCPLVSLTLHKTRVKDISIARHWPTLQRLHIADTAITDLTPLRGLRLRRLILSPQNIRTGWEAIREMTTLQELDVEFREDRRWTPEEFWQHFDAGTWRSSADQPTSTMSSAPQ
ncbi:MAG: hypothetical protein KatS3mg113_0042 [Planctomycetaceae bacterium]|nr:MAG: hypothetical protein KatS3mg113_0042 [Planctomycetaceae bacterium]